MQCGALHTLTCDGFHHILRDLRDFFIHRHTQHLDGDPVQSSETQRTNRMCPKLFIHMM